MRATSTSGPQAAITFDGAREAAVEQVKVSKNNCWTEFNVKGNLPSFDIAPGPLFTTLHDSRFYNPGRLDVTIQNNEGTADNDELLDLCVPEWGSSYSVESHYVFDLGPDNFGYSNHGCTPASLESDDVCCSCS